MLCSARELGLGEGHEGIIELPDQLAVGRDLREALGLDDTILELNLTPNRGDALSITGVARELSAISGATLNKREVAPVVATIPDRFEVRLAAPEACPRFAGRVIRGLRPDAVSPLWMVERLRRAGLRAISPVVVLYHMRLFQPKVRSTAMKKPFTMRLASVPSPSSSSVY